VLLAEDFSHDPASVVVTTLTFRRKADLSPQLHERLMQLEALRDQVCRASAAR
jgi:hypothetical protein